LNLNEEQVPWQLVEEKILDLIGFILDVNIVSTN
jgi:hypothetical protein